MTPGTRGAGEERLLAGRTGAAVDAERDWIPQAAAVVPQPRRRSRKSELRELRELVKELEGQLASLQTRKDEPGDGAASVLAAVTSPAALWERTARAQKEERVRAEVENARLREVLEGQIKVAVSLEKLLRKRPSHEALELTGSAAKRLAVAPADKDAALFDALGERLDELYERLDATWLETGLVVNQHEMDETEAKLDAFDNIFMEVVSSKVVPFSANRVSDAAWELMASDIQVTNGHILAIERSDEVVKSRFFLTLKLRRSEAQIVVSMAVKRFVEDSGRIAFTWACEGDITGNGIGGQLINVSEEGWAVLEKHRMTSPSLGLDECADGESCILQMCMRMVPGHSGSSPQKVNVRLLSEMLAVSYTTNIGWLVQRIENMLLSDSHARANPDREA